VPHLSQVTAHLHGDDSQMILLITPYQERLGVVVVDASSSGPEAARIGSLQHDKEKNTRV
jgi:hypothetical protein